ncbi:MAG: hypothetical protein ABIF08_03185 [Nanoarchaeota archaeon]
MNYKRVSFVAVLTILIIFSGITISGFIVGDPIINGLREDSEKWLATEEGKNQFPGAKVKDIYVVLNNERTEPTIWLISFQTDDGMITGYVETHETSFDRPPVYTKFARPMENMFMNTENDAYSLMIEHSDYSAPQIEKPVLVISQGTIMWHSTVRSGSEEIDYFEVPAFWNAIEIYNKDGKIKIKE